MKFGIREVCNIAFKARSEGTKMGTKVFKKDEVVIFFDSAKTSSLSGSSTEVAAQGGRGNPKLITWEGEKEIVFTFEEALISPIGMAILTGANLIDDNSGYYHQVRLRAVATEANKLDIEAEVHEIGGLSATINDPAAVDASPEAKAGALFVYKEDGTEVTDITVAGNVISAAAGIEVGKIYTVDGYVKVAGSTISIEANKFSDYFYIEAETLFRQEADGVDKAAQIIIPKGKVKSNFEFTMANSGDPSTFAFEVTALEDFTKFDRTKKVQAVINIID